MFLAVGGPRSGVPFKIYEYQQEAKDLPEAIKAVTELGASTKRVCVCTDDRDADDLFEFGLDWVTRQAIVAGLSPLQAWPPWRVAVTPYSRCQRNYGCCTVPCVLLCRWSHRC